MAGLALQAGALRQRVTIEVPAGAPDGAGGVGPGWRPLATVWGAVELWGEGRDGTGAQPELVGEAPAGVVRRRVRVRWRGDLTGAARLRVGGRTLAIRGLADPDGRRRWLVIDTDDTGA